ncbi:MAG: transcriptional repressor [Deltaproteobacteria bacterium]|jgi:Fur family ferric uptake transcriptional regulator|nr:transcriptional repressor [Deltaproteobacteria bacterium]
MYNKDKAEFKNTFIKYIEEKGLRHTKQREAIVDAFFSAGRHITSEELFNIVKKKNPEIGYATVQRNLNLLCKSSLAEEIKIGKQKTKYEQKLGASHHDHLICVKCGRLIEVNDEKIEKLQDKLARANNFIPIKHKLEIYGICGACRPNKTR